MSGTVDERCRKKEMPDGGVDNMRCWEEEVSEDGMGNIKCWEKKASGGGMSDMKCRENEVWENKMKKHKSELLLPAGSLVKLKTALLYGADAVYAGTPDMSLRTQSKFSLEELEEGIRIVHERGKKIYLTLNLYIHNEEAEKLPQFVDTLKRLKPDGVLVADPGVFYYLSFPRRRISVRRRRSGSGRRWGRNSAFWGARLRLRKWRKSAGSVLILNWNVLCTGQCVCRIRGGA